MRPLPCFFVLCAAAISCRSPQKHDVPSPPPVVAPAVEPVVPTPPVAPVVPESPPALVLPSAPVEAEEKDPEILRLKQEIADLEAYLAGAEQEIKDRGAKILANLKKKLDEQRQEFEAKRDDFARDLDAERLAGSKGGER